MFIKISRGRGNATRKGGRGRVDGWVVKKVWGVGGDGVEMRVAREEYKINVFFLTRATPGTPLVLF